jgi:nitronate monooxygenase
MDFAGGEGSKKAWRDIWGSGQGIGAIDKVQPAGEYVAQLARQFEQSKEELRRKASL